MRDGKRLRSVLVVGSGAREHALVWALRRSPTVGALWAAPGNPGIAALADRVDLAADDAEGIARWAAANAVDLVVVGPEAALAAGLADALAERGIAVFGPTRAAAELEWSKAFAKRFLAEEGIPTAAFAVFDEPEPALAYVADSISPPVVKADGLAAGKGVAVCDTPEEAAAAIRGMLVDRTFGAAGARIVVEERLEGEEVSLIALTDGERIACLPPARDYKRLREGDEGPNTGGMGAYAPAALDPALLRFAEERVLRPTIDGLRRRGRPYRGALYAGLMLTRDGPKVLEFNCRLGDPETQAILPLLDGDLAELLLACATGRLDPSLLTVLPGAAACVTLAAAGYPDRPRLGSPIAGLAEAAATGALLFHAGTAERDGRLVTAGGRVLSVVGRGATLAAATERAYDAAERVRFDGCQMRRDVGAGRIAATELVPA